MLWAGAGSPSLGRLSRSPSLPLTNDIQGALGLAFAAGVMVSLLVRLR